ncbi:hypothetical protein QR680_009171 [Steinernema hermaphroditum]|uniref:Uncharacterized protein n=1 Tax=Steinernema hermaphroditum TaxID=289476 RepID=A0AA39IL45_9BILA|nr:hypothetical protein QR680_009171 [Steinernema hermaphroditum]
MTHSGDFAAFGPAGAALKPRTSASADEAPPKDRKFGFTRNGDTDRAPIGGEEVIDEAVEDDSEDVPVVEELEIAGIVEDLEVDGAGRTLPQFRSAISLFWYSKQSSQRKFVDGDAV